MLLRKTKIIKPTKKYMYSLYPVDGAYIIPVIFFEELMLRIKRIHFIAQKSLQHTAGIELGSPMETIFQSKHSLFELVGPSNDGT